MNYIKSVLAPLYIKDAELNEAENQEMARQAKLPLMKSAVAEVSSYFKEQDFVPTVIFVTSQPDGDALTKTIASPDQFDQALSELVDSASKAEFLLRDHVVIGVHPAEK